MNFLIGSIGFDAGIWNAVRCEKTVFESDRYAVLFCFVLKTRFTRFLMKLIRAKFSEVRVAGWITHFFVYNLIYQLGESLILAFYVNFRTLFCCAWSKSMVYQTLWKSIFQMFIEVVYRHVWKDCAGDFLQGLRIIFNVLYRLLFAICKV